jgi:hypothetical protein
MFLSATSQRQITFVNQSPRFTSHAFKKNANVACVQNRASYLHNSLFILVPKVVEKVIVVVKIQQILVT